MRSTFILPIALCALILSGCSQSPEDPYDPTMGPRNPRPGAEKYLATRNDISESEKQALLNFKTCSLTTLQDLANSPAREVRSLVASNPSSDETILEKLSSDTESGVRQYVVTNPNISLSLLEKLKNDPDETVQWQVQRILETKNSQQ